MDSKEIRSLFLEFFKKNNHEIVNSSSLIPEADPTLLFTNAGMVQFKNVFLGKEKRNYTRAASCQKCLRAGGKQSDIENVGFTARHHTFFEMLGNFSFGDYFKKEAIALSWQLLTDWFKIPVDRLWVSVFENDNESIDFWKDNPGINPDRIVRLGEKDNFWQMGDKGPCGPCSEILIDQGESVGCGKKDCAVGCDCDRFLELWNLVFMEYNRSEDGKLTPLPKPSIDTGMGLERLAAVCQKKRSNFDTDLFKPIMDAITLKTSISYGSNKTLDTSIRIIADHMRAITFLLSEGLVPSNEERGYVLRRIIRRASRHAKKLGVDRPFLYELIESVIGSLGEVYPEIFWEKKRSEEILKFEEERFSKTLEKGLMVFEEIIPPLKKSGAKIIPGSEVFRLYDTYGFPSDITEDIAKENGLEIDWDGFHKEMEAQKSRGKFEGTWPPSKLIAEGGPLIYEEASSIVGQTDFRGYDNLETDSRVLLIIKGQKDFAKELKESDEGDIILDKTPFYGESGGQVGDIGLILSDKVTMEVKNSIKSLNGLLHIHHVKIKKGVITVLDRVLCRVDERQRKATMRNHTATHLLHATLRNVLGDHVKQAGSLVEPQRLRFDFNHFYPLSHEEKNKIEDLVNSKIFENLPVSTHVMPMDDALHSGAIALFDEKYGENVRVIEIDNYSRELCGGTHCHATGEIGPFVIISESSIASGVRRIEALTGLKAYDFLRERAEKIVAISEYLKTDNPLERVLSLMKKVKELEKELEQLRFRSFTQDISSLMESAVMIDGIKVLVTRKDGLEKKELRDFADKLRDRIGSGIVFVASVIDSQSFFISMVTKDLTDRFNASKILNEIASLSGGKGGGRPYMAQGGTKTIDNLDSDLDHIYDIIKKTEVI